MDKRQLANKIWESANNMRSKIEASEYKDYILGFIFYKFLSEKLVKFFKDDGYSDEDLARELSLQGEEGSKQYSFDDVRYAQNNLGYFIGYENLFSSWIKNSKTLGVDNVRDALNAFDRLIKKDCRPVLGNIFNTLQNSLNKLGDTAGAQSKAINNLLHLINEIPMNDQTNYDVLGFIYEYLISMFAANAGKKAGEFYTPHEVSLLMSEIIANHLKDNDEIHIYDSTSGSGSLLINIGKAISQHNQRKNNITYYAQELKDNTYNLTRMNLMMRNILIHNIKVRNGDTLGKDWPLFEDADPDSTYERVIVDAVVSNPPYSQIWDPANKESDPRFASYGLAPKSKADYAFLLHDLYHLKNDGIMAIVLPHGVLFRGKEEERIRKNLIEKNNIDTIIGLPHNIFFGTGIPTIIIILKQTRNDDKILIIDASKGFEKVGKNNQLRSSDIKKIVDTVNERIEIDKYSVLVSKEEIRKNDYNLNISRYVDSDLPSETWDIYASIFGGIPNDELNNLNQYWQVFPNLKNTLFNKINEHVLEIKDKNIEDIILKNDEVLSYQKKFNESFSNFSYFLEKIIFTDLENFQYKIQKEIIVKELFKKIGQTALVDKYVAYEFFNKQWEKIVADLEKIQSDESFDCTKKVITNTETKKKGSESVEVIKGYVGYVIPFELVQKTKLKDQYEVLKNLKIELEEIQNSYQEIFESLSDDEKENELINQEKAEFKIKEIRAYCQKLTKKETSEFDSFDSKMFQVIELNNNEKNLLTTIKKQSLDLEVDTKFTIENLTNEEVLIFLKQKWIKPLLKSIEKLPTISINQLIRNIYKLNEKYNYTLINLNKEIEETSNKLIDLIGELEADEFDKKGLQELQNLLRK